MEALCLIWSCQPQQTVSEIRHYPRGMASPGDKWMASDTDWVLLNFISDILQVKESLYGQLALTDFPLAGVKTNSFQRQIFKCRLHLT